jgi:hypothetical protein
MNSRILAMIKNETEKWLVESCVIQKRAPTSSPRGAPKAEFENTATVDCRIITEQQGARGAAEVIGGKETLTDAYRIILPAGTEIAKDYRVVSGEFTYEIIGILDKRTDGNDVQVRARRMR